ncbi:MAG: hypothetical protein WBS54_00160 [Acidobacteriota bacterium]
MRGRPALSLTHQTGGRYDFLPTAMPSRPLTHDFLPRHVSGHFPLSVEFATR